MIILNIAKRLIALIMTLVMGSCLMGEDSLKIKNVPFKQENAVRIISQNVRYNDDAYGSVENRSRLLVKMINAYEPDSVGFQEATPRWMDILIRELGDKYGYIYQMRDESEESEACAIFYLKEKYNLVSGETFWLSETPEVPYSKLEQAGLARIATWAELENKVTGQRYIHINTHLDNAGEEVRDRQAQLLCQKLSELEEKGCDIVCTGDFNDTKFSDMYKTMTAHMSDSMKIADDSDIGKTYHDYGNLTTAFQRIDYIFLSKDIKALRYKVINEQVAGMYISDHYGVMADIILAE